LQFRHKTSLKRTPSNICDIIDDDGGLNDDDGGLNRRGNKNFDRLLNWGVAVEGLEDWCVGEQEDNNENEDEADDDGDEAKSEEEL